MSSDSKRDDGVRVASVSALRVSFSKANRAAKGEGGVQGADAAVRALSC